MAAKAQLSADQQDLLARCDGLQMNNTTANQVDALDEMVADDFAVARTQTLLFANTQYAGVMDRLMALRGGAKGLSLAGLNIIVDGEPVPLAQLQEMAKGLFGGGASADEPGGLLDDKWGLWARGNYSFGEKDRNTKSPGFDADQWAMVGGVDYRFSDKLVGGCRWPMASRASTSMAARAAWTPPPGRSRSTARRMWRRSFTSTPSSTSPTPTTARIATSLMWTALAWSTSMRVATRAA